MLNANAKFAVTKHFMLGKERIQSLQFLDKVNIFNAKNVDFKPLPVLFIRKCVLILLKLENSSKTSKPFIFST